MRLYYPSVLPAIGAEGMCCQNVVISKIHSFPPRPPLPHNDHTPHPYSNQSILPLSRGHGSESGPGWGIIWWPKSRELVICGNFHFLSDECYKISVVPMVTLQYISIMLPEDWIPLNQNKPITRCRRFPLWVSQAWAGTHRLCTVMWIIEQCTLGVKICI